MSMTRNQHLQQIERLLQESRCNATEAQRYRLRIGYGISEEEINKTDKANASARIAKLLEVSLHLAQN